MEGGFPVPCAGHRRPGRPGGHADRGFKGIHARRGPARAAQRPALCRVLCSRPRSGNRHAPVTAVEPCQAQGIGPSKEDSKGREEPVNLHRIKKLQQGAGRSCAAGMVALPGKDSGVGKPSGSPPPTGRGGKTADRGRQPEILKPAPIRHFVKFLLRALFRSGLGLGRRPHSPHGEGNARLTLSAADDQGNRHRIPGRGVLGDDRVHLKDSGQ